MKYSFDRNNKLGLAYSLAGTFFLATNFITAKHALLGFNPAVTGLLWAGSGSIISLMIVIAKGRAGELIIGPESRAGVVSLGIITGFTLIASWEGLSRLDPSYAAFMWRFTPVFTILVGAIFLGERLTRAEIIPAVLMIAGAFATVAGHGEATYTGAGMIIVAVILFAVQALVAKRRVYHVDIYALVFYRTLFAAMVIGLWTFIGGQWDISGGRWDHYAALVAGSAMGPVLGGIMLYKSYRHWEISRAALAGNTQPLFVMPMAFAILEAWPEPNQLYGGFVILIGAVWLTWIHYFRETQTAEMDLLAGNKAGADK